MESDGEEASTGYALFFRACKRTCGADGVAFEGDDVFLKIGERVARYGNGLKIQQTIEQYDRGEIGDEELQVFGFNLAVPNHGKN